MFRSTNGAKIRSGAGCAALLLACAAALAQEQPPAPSAAPPPVLENLGKPMAVPFRCTEDDIQWAGLTCSENDPCAVYLEIAAVGTTGDRIFAVGNLHAAAMTLYSVLLASDNAGRTWSEPHERIRGAGLDRVQLADAENGWISGEVVSPLPQDPFLLITSDAGKSWRRQPLFGESRMGSIQQFFFRDKSNGSLIFDRGRGNETGRYQLYESQDGGASWNIKEESDKPPIIKRGPEPSDWRVRADAATQAFQIERRSGERWTRVAAFAVKAGECRPQ